jgi:DNA-binding CsgD family transcriptional regulator
VRRAAEAFRDRCTALIDARIAVSDNIASKRQMRDGEGAILATTVFGWTDSESDAWWRRPGHALSSPLPAGCRYESEPFWVNAEGYRTRGPNPLLAQVSLEDFDRRSLAHAAIMVPAHMPFGRIGAAAFVPRDTQHTDLSAEFAAFADQLALYARTFLASYDRVMGPAKRIPVTPKLGRREIECLRWAAVGKTDQEIGLILSRSRATVRFHLENAALKLGAVNRSQTLFKAQQLGYIGLDT